MPPFYREVYETLCPNQENLSKDTFAELFLSSSGLANKVLTEVSLLFFLLLVGFRMCSDNCKLAWWVI